MIRYTSQCRQCSEELKSQGAADNAVILYDSERERDDEADRHMQMTGHTLVLGYIDTSEERYTCPRCETFYESAHGDLREFKKDHNERICVYGF